MFLYNNTIKCQCHFPVHLMAPTKLPAANFYQLFAYLRQQSCQQGWERAEGVLLYPRTDRDFAVDFVTHGHRIRALSLDLTRTWQEIHGGLMEIAMGSGRPMEGK
jgi:hypothetical protein